MKAAISGAYLYGFPSPDSDYDLRGAPILPLENVVGLVVRQETVEDSRVFEGLAMDMVSHDIRKFSGLLLKKNGYVIGPSGSGKSSFARKQPGVETGLAKSRAWATVRGRDRSGPTLP